MLSSNFALTSMNSPRALQQRKLRSRTRFTYGTWRDYAKNAVERRPMSQKKFGKDSFGLRPLQPPEIAQNRQSFLWKSLEENRRGLEKLGEKAWARLYFDIFAPADWRAIRLHINILNCYSSLQRQQRPARSRNVAALAERVVAVPGARRARDGKTESPGNGAATA